MKSFRQFVSEQTATNELEPLTTIPPAMLTMSRISIRTYPGMNVALYYAKPINRYFTVLYHQAH